MALQPFNNLLNWRATKAIIPTSLISKYGGAVNTTTTIYTVTSGKTLYLFYGFARCTRDSSGNSSLVFVADTGGATYVELAFDPGLNSTYFAGPIPLTVPIPIPSGYAIKATSQAPTVSVYFAFLGWEE